MSEFNKSPVENRRSAEMHSARETGSVEEFKETSENRGVPESGSTAPHRTRKSKGIDLRLLSSFLVVATVAVAAVAVAAPREDSATILSAQATDSTISCEVEVSGENLQLVLYNDFTRRAYPLESGVGTGEFTDLQPSMEYTLAVVGEGAFGETTLTELTISTDAPHVYVPEPEPISEIYSVTHRCTCAVDGYFHFQIDFIDEAGLYSDFYASLTDAYGNVSECVFTEDLHADQRIGVTVGARLLGQTAEFLLTYQKEGERVELCHETVKI